MGLLPIYAFQSVNRNKMYTVNVIQGCIQQRMVLSQLLFSLRNLDFEHIPSADSQHKVHMPCKHLCAEQLWYKDMILQLQFMWNCI